MSTQSPMCVRFWGVRGTISSAGPDTVRYGGNTPCVEVRCGEHLIILDAGTGIRVLGNTLMSTMSAVDVDIFFPLPHRSHQWAALFSARLCARKSPATMGGKSTAGVSSRGRRSKTHEPSA